MQNLAKSNDLNISLMKKPCCYAMLYALVAERLLAAQNPLTQTDRPHQLFADAPPVPPSGMDLHQQIPGMPLLPGPPSGSSKPDLSLLNLLLFSSYLSGYFLITVT